MIPTFHINGVIGEGDNTASVLDSFLHANAGVAVSLVVNSPGGLATEGAAMMGMVEQHGQVDAKIFGIAASAASLVVVGARHIAMHSAAMLMIHNPAALTFGTASELRTEAAIMDKITETYAQAYARATGNPVERILAWMEEETWMTAEEALALHFCDEILDPNEPAKAVAIFDYRRFKAAPSALLQVSAAAGRGKAAKALFRPQAQGV
jgi:ATP-dependent Clp protease protease subunit